MSTPSLPSRPVNHNCPRCGQRMSLGQALNNPAPGPGPMKEKATPFPKPPDLINCLKCHACGHSETLPEGWEYPCARCQSPMVIGLACFQPEIPAGVTTDQDPYARLVPCLKCIHCGRSETLPPDWGLPKQITEDGLMFEPVLEEVRRQSRREK